MLKPFKNLIYVFLILFGSIFALANEHGEAPAAGAAKPVESYSGTQSDEWVKAEAELNALKAKLDAQQGLVQNLLPQKPHAASAAEEGGHKPPPPAGPPKSNQEKAAELNKEFAKYKELVEEYNKKVKDFESRYPEKGQALGRKYPRVKNKEIESLEKTLTLDGRIQRLNKKINSQYNHSPENKVEENAHQNSHPQKPQSDLQEKPSPQRKDVTDKIIIVK